MQIARSLSRRFLAAPIVWSAATLSLALGIGAATAVFSVVNSLSLRNLPVAAPQRLVMLTSASDAIEGRPGTYSYATFDEVRRRDLFAGALAWSPASLAVNDMVEPVSALWVSGDFFATLGVPAAVGGTLSSADDVPGGGPRGFVAMISDRLWERQFGRAPGAIGSQMVVEKTPVTIIGVTPRSFRGVEIGRAYDLYLPFRVQPQIAPNTPSSPDAAILGVMLRLRDGQSLAAGINALRLAQPAIRAASAPAGAIGYLEEPFLLLPSGRGPSALRERYEAALVALLAVAILALLVGCANVANLTMVHGVTRRKELSVRLALGASRWALVRALMVESLALGAVGVVLALVVMTWATGVLVSGLSRAVPGTALDVSFDWRVLVFASIAGSVSAMLFGVVPAFRATRLAPVSILHAEGRGPSDGVRVGAMNVVLAAQTAITLVLVLNAGLFIRTFQELTRVPLGFDPEGLLSVTVSAPYTAPADRNRLYHRLVEVASTVPGVAQAGGGLSEPLRRVGVPIALTVSGAQPLAYAESLSYADDVTPGWRRAYGLHLRAGRDIDGRDVVGAEQVVVVNETFVQRFFPGENILGRTLSLTAHVPPDGEIDVGDRVVIGIVADAAHDSVRGAKRPIIYRPLAQRDGPLFIAFHLLVRSAALSTGRLADEVTGALRGVNPALRMTLRPMAETVDAVLAEDRLLTYVSTFAAGLSLLLAAIGLYGLTAYSVACRRAEIAVRLALGGVPRSILRLVLLQLVRVLAVGVSVGLAMSLWASQFLSSLLYGVSARNPVVMVGGVIMLVVTAVAAAFLPAYRASLGDPAIALRDT